MKTPDWYWDEERQGYSEERPDDQEVNDHPPEEPYEHHVPVWDMVCPSCRHRSRVEATSSPPCCPGCPDVELIDLIPAPEHDLPF